MNAIARRASTALTAVLAALLAGCATTLTGVSGGESYACQAPVGAQCTSVSGVYANALRGMSERPRPLQPAPASKAPTAVRNLADASAVPSVPQAVPAPAPLRSNPRVLRLWIAPWEDADGDLHDASTVHVVVDSGHWLVDRVRPPARSRFDAVVPPHASPLSPPLSPPPAPPSADVLPVPR